MRTNHQILFIILSLALTAKVASSMDASFQARRRRFPAISDLEVINEGGDAADTIPEDFVLAVTRERIRPEKRPSVTVGFKVFAICVMCAVAVGMGVVLFYPNSSRPVLKAVQPAVAPVNRIRMDAPN